MRHGGVGVVWGLGYAKRGSLNCRGGYIMRNGVVHVVWEFNYTKQGSFHLHAYLVGYLPST
jgi:hypothetical protein